MSGLIAICGGPTFTPWSMTAIKSASRRSGRRMARAGAGASLTRVQENFEPNAVARRSPSLTG